MFSYGFCLFRIADFAIFVIATAKLFFVGFCEANKTAAVFAHFADDGGTCHRFAVAYPSGYNHSQCGNDKQCQKSEQNIVARRVMSSLNAAIRIPLTAVSNGNKSLSLLSIVFSLVKFDFSQEIISQFIALCNKIGQKNAAT